MSAWLWFAMAVAAMSTEALAQRADDTSRAQVILRRDTGQEAADLGEMRRRAFAEVDWKLTLGVAEVRTESGERVTATPFIVRARVNEGRTAFKLSGDGYTRVRSTEESLAGFADVNAMVTQVVAPGTVLEGGVTLPAGGEIGSAHDRERLGAIYNHVFSSRWEGQVHGRLTRYDAEPKPGVGRVRRQGVAQIAYNLDEPRSDVLFQLVRTYRPGAGGAALAAVVYEHPLAQHSRPPMLALSVGRGLSSGGHDNSVEVDFSLRF